MKNAHSSADFFSRVSFNHCPREANRAPHVSGKHDEGHLDCVWDGDPLGFSISVIADSVLILPK